jgi:hypothetical protein
LAEVVLVLVLLQCEGSAKVLVCLDVSREVLVRASKLAHLVQRKLSIWNMSLSHSASVPSEVIFSRWQQRVRFAFMPNLIW